MEKSKVYFTRDMSPAGAIRAFEKLGVKLEGNVAVKLHSGEPGNQNFLRPAFMKDIVERVNGTIVECNTAYDGGRNTTEAHKKTMLLHGWTEIADVDIMDAEGEMELPVHGGKHLEVNFRSMRSALPSSSLAYTRSRQAWSSATGSRDAKMPMSFILGSAATAQQSQSTDMLHMMFTYAILPSMYSTTLFAASAMHGVGSREYELIDMDVK